MKVPPLHMPICQGPVVSKKIQKNAEDPEEVTDQCNSSYCNLCFKLNEGKSLKCLNSNCNLNSHVICLSKYFLGKGDYVPIEGRCPKCGGTFLWGDIIRKYKGCYNTLDLRINIDSANDFYCSDSD